MKQALLYVGAPVVIAGFVLVYEFFLPLYHPEPCRCRRCKWRA